MEERMEIDKELIDKLLADYRGPEDLIGEQGLLKQLTKALVERAMQAELTHHLGYSKNDPAGRGSGNSRNGVSTKTLKGDFGEAAIEVPRDRNGTFEPKIVGKHERRFSGFDDKILSMYARDDHARDSRAFTGNLWRGGLGVTDLGGDGCGAGRSKGVADAAAGATLPNPVLGCPDGEDAT
jgi:putative transposase